MQWGGFRDNGNIKGTWLTTRSPKWEALGLLGLSQRNDRGDRRQLKVFRSVNCLFFWFFFLTSRTLGRKESWITPSIPPEAMVRTSLEEESDKNEKEGYNVLETFP